MKSPRERREQKGWTSKPLIPATNTASTQVSASLLRLCHHESGVNKCWASRTYIY